MRLVRFVALSALAAAILFPRVGAAQTFPVVAGTWQVQGGLTGTVLPEAYDALWSAQVELRGGMFVAEGWQIQAAGDARVWPLGSEAPTSYAITGSVLWFPRMGDHRNLYLLGGGGGFSRGELPGQGIESGFQPLLRGAVGTNIKMPGEGWSGRLHLTTEFRGDVWFEESTSFVAGIVFALSWFSGQK